MALELPEDREWTTSDVENIVKSAPVVVFGKGEKAMPMCGYTNRAFQVLNACEVDYEVVNIFRHESIRPALVEYSDLKTTPQVFVGGVLIGGSDIALAEYEAGTLQEKIKAALEKAA